MCGLLKSGWYRMAAKPGKECGRQARLTYRSHFTALWGTFAAIDASHLRKLQLKIFPCFRANLVRDLCSLPASPYHNNLANRLILPILDVTAARSPSAILR